MEISLDIVDNSKKTYTKPIFTKDLSNYGQITCIELSGYDYSQNVVLIGFIDKILIAHLKFTDIIQMEIISELAFPCRCTCLNVSLETNLSIIPSSVLFCAAGSDFKVRVIKTDLNENNVCKILNGHTNYINDVKFDNENKFIASVSDDNTAKIWEVENYQLHSNIQLNFPGVCVQWHKEDTSKLLIGDKLGVISLYNVDTMKPLISIDTGKPLSSAHWCPTNNQILASLQLGELSIWDISVSSIPKSTNLIFTENGGYIKFNPQGDMIAALNRLEGTLKVYKINLQEQQFSTFINLPTNFSWHNKYPIICAGNDTKFCIWKINTI